MSLSLFPFKRSLRPLALCRNYASGKAAAAKFPKEVPRFSSAHSLDKIYPNSRLDLAAVPEPPLPQTPDSFSGYIPVSQLTIRYARSGGPGGQHAHKTNTKVSVSFHLQSAEWIPESTRTELMRISEKTRAQTLNLADCLDKIRCYVQEATIKLPVVPFELVEQRRQRIEKAAAVRLQQKRIHSMRKQEKNIENW